MTRYRFIWLIVLAAVLASCSTTRNLPENEVLYTGISEIAYGRKAGEKLNKQLQALKDSTGVIISLAQAYNTVENLLIGNASARDMLNEMKKLPKDITPEQKDSIRHEIAVAQDAFSTVKGEVQGALSMPPNNSIMGSSFVRWNVPIGLWAYNRYVNSTSGFGRLMFKVFATTPKYISTVNPQLRVQVAQQTLKNYGFFQGRVDYDIQPSPRNERKAKIGYSVFLGPLYRLGGIAYQNFTPATDSLIRRSQRASLIHEGDAFRASELDAERKRLSEMFRNNGFYFFKPEYINYRADTLQHPLHVQLQVRPRPEMPPQARNKFYMGHTTITVLPYDEFTLTDSSEVDSDFTMRWGGGSKPPLRFSAIRRNLFYRRGSLYRQRIHEIMQEQLAGMGVFSSLQVNYVPRDTTATCDTLDVNILAILDKPYDEQFDARVTNKTSGLLGPGLSVSLNKRNALRGAEQLSLKLFGSYEWQTGSSKGLRGTGLMNSFELGASAAITFPRIRFLGVQRWISQQARTSTSFKIDVDWLTRSGYFQMLKLGTRVTYTYQKHRAWKHEFVPFRLDYDQVFNFTDQLLQAVLKYPSLLVSLEDLFVPSIAYTVTYSPRMTGRHKRSLEFSGKEGGNLLSAIYACAGQPFNKRNKTILGIPFAQFWKLTAEWRESYPIGERSSIVARAFAGAVWSYGNSDEPPYSELFSVGGANSIRAFASRSIGPGSVIPLNKKWNYILQVGELKMEANVEWRFPLVGHLEGALFLDAGNVWNLRADGDDEVVDDETGEVIEIGNSFIGGDNFLKTIALGTGLGLRYNMEFLVLRFDVGVGLHAPYKTSKSGFYNLPRFRDSLGFHIAVGYPF